MRIHRAFTLIELIAVIVILAVLSAVALPKYFDYSSEAKNAADEGSIGGINTALNLAYIDHRMNNAPAGDRITNVNDIDTVMEGAQLPLGITVAGAQLTDQRGNLYDFTAETADAPASVTLADGGGGS
jgi:MSHA pilin protein MshA